MPQIFKIGSFWVYFWSNEGVPLEPVHVHVSEGMPAANATKIWITRARKCLLANYKFGQTCRKFRQVQIKSFLKLFVVHSIEIRITPVVM